MVELELLTDGLESERWSVCVFVCVCWGTGDIYKDRVPLVPRL